jgi:hypothetical protein
MTQWPGWHWTLTMNKKWGFSGLATLHVHLLSSTRYISKLQTVYQVVLTNTNHVQARFHVLSTWKWVSRCSDLCLASSVLPLSSINSINPSADLFILHPHTTHDTTTAIVKLPISL